jgi:hypothetical protein
MSAVPVAPSVRLRPARPTDTPRLLRLLPQIATALDRMRCLVAESASDRRILGGASLLLGRDPRGGGTASFQWATEEKASPDTARLLIAGCIAQARAAGAQSLLVRGGVTEGSPADGLLREFAFQPVQTLVQYDMDVAAGWKAVQSAYRWIERKGGIPADGRVIALSEAPLVPVVELITRYLGAAQGLDWHTPGSRVRADISTVVQKGPRTIGALIVYDIDGAKAEAPYDVVDEEFRTSWVTVAMWHRTFQKGTETGYKTVHFKTNDEQFRTFANFARRMNSKPVGREIWYRMDLQDSAAGREPGERTSVRD